MKVAFNLPKVRSLLSLSSVSPVRPGVTLGKKIWINSDTTISTTLYNI